MGGKTAIALGLVAGIAAGSLMVGGLLTLTPVPEPSATPTAPPVATPSAVPSAVPSVVPSAPSSEAPSSETPSRTPAAPLPSGPGPVTNSPGPSASTLGEAFGIGQPSLRLVHRGQPARPSTSRA
jgi:hypothetical protein